MNYELILLAGALVLLLSILVGKAGSRFGLPSLLLFLGVGMLVGTDGLGLEFSSPAAAQFIGMLALSVILFSGGMDTKVEAIRPVAVPGVALATVGVAVTTLFTGMIIYLLFSWFDDFVTLSLPESLLLAAVMSSTDSASVFSILRSRDINLRERLRPLLELESGSNDPMAYLLTVVLISYIQGSGSTAGGMALMFIGQLVIGVMAGLVLGRIIVWTVNHVHLDNGSLYSVMLLAMSFAVFGLTAVVGGNGYLAVYLAGMVVGNSRMTHRRSLGSFMEGYTWLWQIVMFITLGLLVNPREMVAIAVPGGLVALAMMFVARPLSVLVCLAPFHGFSWRGRAYVAWVGLRGAAPIIFATYPLIAGVTHASMFFNIVFFVTLISLLCQGTTVAAAARWLKLVGQAEPKREIAIELPEEITSAVSEFAITKAVLAQGNRLADLPLPAHTLAVMVKRGSQYFVPKGNTELHDGDRLLVISDRSNDLLKVYEALGVSQFTWEKNNA
jgi:cell volume regulation protein A